MNEINKIEDSVRSALKKFKTAYCDIRYQTAFKTRLEFQGKEIKRTDINTDQGGIVRVLGKGGFGISVFNRIEDLSNAILDAKSFAKRLKGKKVSLKETEIVQDKIQLNIKENYLNIPLSDKIDLLKNYNDILLSSSGIISSRIFYGDSISKSYFASNEGSFIYEEFPDIQLSMSAVARDGNLIQTAHDGVAGSKGFEIARGLAPLAQRISERAASMLKAKPLKGGNYDVILDPTLAGTFAHEAFGHLSESDFVYENKKLRAMMKFGRTIGSKILNILDDSSMEGLRGTHKYDDEGVKTRKNYLIKEGKLVGRLHSRVTAKVMSEGLTGNARAVNYRHEPIVRMTNTYIDSQNAKLEDLLKELKNGVIAYDFFGGNTAFELFTFSSAYAYAVKNGKIEEMVRDVVLSGNLFETMKNICAVSDKVEWNETGGCGKGNQSGLPTPTGSPYILIKNVMVGGE